MVPKETVISTLSYSFGTVVIQSIEYRLPDKSTANKIVISKLGSKKTTINNVKFILPEMGNIIWTITANDLQTPENACKNIDATLCREHRESHCFDTCITNGPGFVSYDEGRGLIYLDASTDASDEEGYPRFLFVGDLNTKIIKYLRTIDEPGVVEALLSPALSSRQKHGR